jgi:hypothetical protein
LGLIGRRQRLIILQFSADTEGQHLPYASSIALVTIVMPPHFW